MCSMYYICSVVFLFQFSSQNVVSGVVQTLRFFVQRKKMTLHTHYTCTTPHYTHTTHVLHPTTHTLHMYYTPLHTHYTLLWKNSEILSINIHPHTHMWGWGFLFVKEEMTCILSCSSIVQRLTAWIKNWNPKNWLILKIWKVKTWTEIPVCFVVKNHQSVTEWMKWINTPLKRFCGLLFDIHTKQKQA